MSESKFCPAPFVGLVQDSHGHGGPCPYVSGSYWLKKIPLQERWQSPVVQKLREEYLAGKVPEFCNRCHKEEAAGFQSLRKNMVEWYPDLEERVKNESYNYQAGPKKLVIRVSNICNFACRSCHSADSSLFAREGAYYDRSYDLTENRYLATLPRKQFSGAEMNQMVQLNQNLERIEFFGGEPMMNTSHHEMLRELIRAGKAKDITLFYCTNGSHALKPERAALWKEFKQVNLNFSLDAIDKWFHYIRWPGQWEKVKANIFNLKNEAAKEINLSFSVNLTVTLLNLFHLPEIYGWIHDNVATGRCMTIAHEPAYYCISNLPDQFKESITERYRQSPHWPVLQEVAGFMNATSSNPARFREFVEWTVRMDRYRRVKFKKYFPEYHALIKSQFDPMARMVPRPKGSRWWLLLGKPLFNF
jgi:hypothetical protein